MSNGKYSIKNVQEKYNVSYSVLNKIKDPLEIKLMNEKEKIN